MITPDYNMIFPFYMRSRFLGVREEAEIDKSAVIFPSWYSVSPEAVERLKKIPRRTKYWNFVQILPTNLLVPVFETHMDYQILWMKVHWERLGEKEPRISGKVKEAYYPSVINRLDIPDGDDGIPLRAFMTDGAFEIDEFVVPDVESILALLSNDTLKSKDEILKLWVAPGKVGRVEGSQVTEADAIDLKKKRKVKIHLPDVIETYLKDYILDRGHTQRIPLLIGNTAVAKSAIVKTVAKELGYRLIDLRCQFMDKLDVEGLVKRKIGADGKTYSYNASMDKMLEATDDFIKYAKTMVEKIDDYIKQNSKMPAKELKALKESRVKFKEKTKPCVLFFDEITRAPPSIRKAFTTLLNQKTFQGKTMNNCRMISATNVPIELPEDFHDIYLTETIEDVATLDRFEVVQVTPAGIFDRWKDHAQSTVEDPDHPRKGMPTFHKAVMSFIGNDVNKAYSFKMALEAVGYDPSQAVMGEGGVDPEEISITPFPNYRTWEYVSDHLYAVELGHVTYNIDIIMGFIGNNTLSREFLQHMSKKYSNITNTVSEKTLSGNSKSDTMLAGVEESIDSTVPCLLLGMSSFGKTTRLFELEKRRKKSSRPIHVIPINLALKDRTDIMGAPSSTGIEEEYASSLKALGTDKQGKPTHPLYKEMKRLDSFDLPDQVTTMAPNLMLQTEIKTAINKGELVVLFFDELNRAHSTVMSAVFEAISDNRFMGITWKTGQVTVVAAGNYGPHHPDAEAFDPAFAARFTIFRKDSITPDDTENVLAFMENKDGDVRDGPPFDPIIVDFIRDMTPTERITMFTEIEERTISSSATSLRSFSDLDALITKVKRPVFQGAIMPYGTATKFARYPFPDPTRPDQLETFLAWVRDRLAEVPPNWAGFNSNYIADLGDEKRNMKDLHEGLLKSLEDMEKELKNQTIANDEVDVIYDTLNDLIVFYNAANLHVSRERLSSFEAILGGEPKDALGGDSRAKQFQEVFDKRRGFEQLTISDLINEALVNQYMDQFEGAYPSQDAYIQWSVRTMEDYVDTHEFGSSAPSDPRLGGYLMLRLMEEASAPEWIVSIVASAQNSEQVMTCLEQIDDENRIRRGHALVGEPVDDDAMDAWINRGAA